jgi:hypothetical protein
MDTNNPDIIPVVPADDSKTSGLGRRAMLQTIVAGVGAGFAVPGLAGAQEHPVHQHVGTPAAATAQKKAASATYKPEFLDAHQLKTLGVISEAIVPGSTEAKVAPFLDTLLAVESADTQRKFLSSLGAFDMMAIEAHSKPWVALTAAEQDALLQKASTTPAGMQGGGMGPIPGAGGAAAGGKATIGDHFANLKQWVAGAYFSSEKGARELGWDGNVFHTELPGCTHPDGHA